MSAPTTVRPISKVSIITPCRNARKLIAATVESVLAQTAVNSGRVDLEYIICDGASADGTAEVARDLCGSRAFVVSEPDRGMYDALAKGLRRASGDVVAYLNAGDVYSPTAFEVVLDVLGSHPAKWLTGFATILNAKRQLVGCSLPFRFRRSAIRRGVHGRWLPFIQQESTFWRRSLHETLDWDLLSRFRLAGDLYLWSRFATREDLWVVEAYLGGFTAHGNHLSTDKSAYWEEARRFLERSGPIDRALAALEWPVWKGPNRIKKVLNPGRLLRYDHSRALWT